ncbi:hypothetical protein L4X63_09240 [Geomonas sp. Red32]|uniref:phage baseplate assembly protein n=1 Tax=Geomonas sp. Red32 TaxID=2912856 RepID=UPI00202CFFDC|nr:hypothetical protein [Geomonas sp. Red32]MCM0081772.1 hypothetical protein [Geomonas sp. Red32]
MSDQIELRIGTTSIRNFLSYQVDADLYCADHAFTLELANPEVEIQKGAACKLFVNGELALTGIVDKRHRHCDKQGRTLTVGGRDLMGIVVDAYCEEFVSVQGKTIKQLAQMLIQANIKTGRPALPFIGRVPIVGETELQGKLKSRRRRGTADFLSFFDVPQKVAQIYPGQTVFQVLQMYALSRGVMFFGLPDGTFVFDEPCAGGDPDYQILFTQDGTGNALSADVDEDISRAYSKVVVIGQQQLTNPLELDAGTTVQTKGSATDPSFPFYKCFVQVNNNDSQSPNLHSRMILNKMRHDSFKLEYEMPGHSQNGRNYTINRLAAVIDTVHGIRGNFLVTGRTLKRDKRGAYTMLRLGLPGLVEQTGSLSRGGK